MRWSSLTKMYLVLALFPMLRMKTPGCIVYYLALLVTKERGRRNIYSNPVLRVNAPQSMCRFHPKMDSASSHIVLTLGYLDIGTTSFAPVPHRHSNLFALYCTEMQFTMASW